MKRKDFLKTVGAGGVIAAIPFELSARNPDKDSRGSTCVLIPSETPGPFPLDLSDNTFYFRQDVREDRTGAPQYLRMRIIGIQNCEPMANVRVNIWHCDNEGNYSGYGTQAGLTYLRGYQMTDANGEVEFLTAFPGWYPGRVCHIHFQVFVNSSYSAVSQLTFEHVAVNDVYLNNTSQYPDGPDPLSPNSDGVFSNGYSLQLATLEAGEVPEVYFSFLEVTVQGTGSAVGLSHQEMMTSAQFILGQNYPNPFSEKTSVPIELKQDADVTIEIWHTMGNKVHSMNLGRLNAGEHHILLDFKALGLADASYLYQCIVNNSKGTFTDVKRMTSLK